MTELWSIENEIYESSVSPLCGVDEAGRGPLAGPVCAAAVILPRGLVIEGLNDSKKLSEKKRELLYDEIIEKAVSYGIAFATVEEIEEKTATGASPWRRAVSSAATANAPISRRPASLPR